MRKLRLIILVPLVVVFSLIAIFIGLFSFGGGNLELLSLQAGNPTLASAALLLMRCGILPFQLLFILLLFIAAFSIHRVRDRIAGWVLRGPIMRKWVLRPSEVVAERALHTTDPEIERFMDRDTAVQVTGSAISFAAYTLAVVLSLGQFLSMESLGVLVTVVTGGLSWGARTLIGDLLGGMSNIAEDNFSVGDRVSVYYAMKDIRGVVERVTVRMVSLRATTGELYIVPHGELRVLRNYSRGEFGGAYVEIHVSSRDLDRTVQLLDAQADAATTAVGPLQLPWQVISRTGNVTESTSISLFFKSDPGDEDVVRLAVMEYVQGLLAAEGIGLAPAGGAA